jgi:hypothetical protein
VPQKQQVQIGMAFKKSMPKRDAKKDGVSNRQVQGEVR